MIETAAIEIVISSMWAATKLIPPKKNPTVTIPTAQTRAPTRFRTVKERCDILPTPATTGTNVRTTGTNRPRTTASAPRLAKKACARSAFSCRNRRDSGLEKTLGP